jgi:hypothetical protein
MTTRAKFTCTLNEHHEDGNTIRLDVVTYGSPENDKFFEATPSGELYLSIVNLTAAEMFEVGKEYYIDISQA